MRTLAIDLGTRRVGLAISDAGGRLATPCDVLHVALPEQAFDPVIQLIRREEVARVVVGLPVNMDGTIGPAARSTIAWARTLGQRIGGATVLFVDERLSSFDAEQQLAARKRAGEKITRKRKKEQLDALAAATLLQAFLDGRLPAITEAELP